MDLPVAPGGQADRRARAARCARAGLRHEDPRLRPQLVRAPGRHRHRRRPARSPRPSTRPTCCRAAPRAGSPAPRSTATAATRAARPSCSTRFPDKGIWFTECSGSHGPTDPPAQVFSDTLKWHARNLVLGVTRNWGKTVVNWNLALDPAGGPHNGGCDTCTGVVTVGPGNTVTRERRVLHARPPGPLRAAGRACGSPARRSARPAGTARSWTPRSATRDGSTALVVHNENDDPRTFAVAQGGASFDYTLPGGALATFTWPDSRRCGRRPAATLTSTGRPRAGRRRRTRSTTTPRRAGRPARRRRRASRCRSTSARRSACAASCSTRAPTAATSRAATRCYTSSDGVELARGGQRRRHGQLTTIDIPATRSRATCASSRPRPRRSGGRSPTCGSTAEEELHDQARADPAPDRGGARALRDAGLGRALSRTRASR